MLTVSSGYFPVHCTLPPAPSLLRISTRENIQPRKMWAKRIGSSDSVLRYKMKSFPQNLSLSSFPRHLPLLKHFFLYSVVIICLYRQSPYVDMLRFLGYAALLFSFLPTLIYAQCTSCDSYTNALNSCQKSSKLYAVGSPMDTASIKCMCTQKTDVTDMNVCLACLEADPQSNIVSSVVSSWITTCNADAQFGDKQAVLCWQSQPDNSIPCYTNSGGSGGSNGGSVVTTSPSAGSNGSASR